MRDGHRATRVDRNEDVPSHPRRERTASGSIPRLDDFGWLGLRGIELFEYVIAGFEHSIAELLVYANTGKSSFSNGLSQ